MRPGNVLVAVRDPRNLYYLETVLKNTDTTKQDVVVMTARIYHREPTFSGSDKVDSQRDLFEEYEQAAVHQGGGVWPRSRASTFR